MNNMPFIFTVLVIAFSLISPFSVAIEEAAYEVLEEDGDFQLRAYEPHIVATTTVESEMTSAGNQGFRILYRYITGDNIAREELEAGGAVEQESVGRNIAMTAPVGQEQMEDKWIVSFMMPSKYTLETLPEPKDERVELREVPARTIAAVGYTGFWSEANYERHKDQLKRWLDEREIAIVGTPIWARYDSPFTLWFMRRNEVLIPVDLNDKEEEDSEL